MLLIFGSVLVDYPPEIVAYRPRFGDSVLITLRLLNSHSQPAASTPESNK